MRFVVAIVFALLSPSLAFCDEGYPWVCTSTVDLERSVVSRGGTEFHKLTDKQFAFMRGAFINAVNTPVELPPGDRGLIARYPDGGGFVVFSDEGRSCAQMAVPPHLIELLEAVERGDVTHVGKKT